MKKYKKQFLIFLLSIFIIVIFIILALFLPFSPFKLKGETNMEKLGIEDENFYSCILEESMGYFDMSLEVLDLLYDKYENFVTEDYAKIALFEDESGIIELSKKMNFEVTEDHLKNITDLTCYNVKNFKGIEKLENLEDLELEGDLGDIDLSKNTKLKYLDINGTLDSIKLSNENLYELRIQESKIKDLNLSDDSNLNYIYVSGSKIDNFDFTDEIGINNLNIYDSEIDNFDFSKISKLTSVNISNTSFDRIDLSNNKNMSNISITNFVKNVTIPNSTAQYYSISLISDELETISFNELIKLDYLYINSDKLASLDLTNVSSSQTLYLYTPNLKQIKFKEDSSHNSMTIYEGDLDLIDVSKINIGSLSFYPTQPLSSKPIIRKMKIKSASLPSYFPLELNEISFDDGSYIKLNTTKVLIDNDKFIFKDSNITLGDIINTNNIFETNGIELKIYETYAFSYREITDVNMNVLDLKNKYLKIYKNNVEIGSYTLSLFDNEFFDDYYLYERVVKAYANGWDASYNLTDEQFNSITGISLNNNEIHIKSYKGLEKLTGITSLSINTSLLKYLPLFDKLETLSVYGTIDNLEISGFKNLTNLYFYADIENLSISNLPALNYLNISSADIKNLSLFKDDLNNVLKRVYIYDTKLESLDLSNVKKLENLEAYSNNIKNIDLSNNSLLTNINLSDNNIESIDLSNNTLLKELDLSNNKLENIDLSNNMLLTYLDLEDNLIKELDIKNNKELKRLYIDGNQIEMLDFSENNKLTYIDYEENPIKKLYGVKNIMVESNTLSLLLPFLEEIDLSGCSELTGLAIYSPNLKEIDLKDCSSLLQLIAISPELKEIKNFDGAEQLAMLGVLYSKIEELDLTSLNNLMYVMLPYAPATKSEVNMLSGTEALNAPKIKFPSQITLETYVEDEYIADYIESTNMIVANNPGQSVITTYMPSLDYNGQIETKAPLKTTVNVYDIKSSKFLVNKEYKYIFNENNEENKVLNRYIKVYGEDVNKEIKDNKLYMYSGDKKIFTFDILEITSNDYKIDNTKNTIYYSETFDISKLNVVNGTLNKIDNEVQLICNDSIVKTYKLEKK